MSHVNSKLKPSSWKHWLTVEDLIKKETDWLRNVIPTLDTPWRGLA